MPTDTLLTAIRTHLDLSPTHTCVIEPITKGASGRTIVRLHPEGFPTYIGIHYTMERKDNANYLPVSEFLRGAKFNVPEVIYDNPGRRVALIEDLGDHDLLSMKEEPWEVREPIYRSALEQLDKLFYTRPPKDLEFQPEFDTDLYRWEQEYFFDQLADELLDMNPAIVDELSEHPALAQMAKDLGASSRNLVHRDFQSQNIIAKDGKAWLIDFQGMRRGRQEYDLASLIYDPYMNHSKEDQQKLLDLWEEVSEEEPIAPILQKCATQRLMQAMGAFAKIGRQPHQEWYLQQIPVAAKILADVVAGSDVEEALSPVIEAVAEHFA
ncbi:phosphotransferase [Verrucomicrobiaceae bacterium N1E253]|uniref:Phosphotransferase n=1 Tax=Oceaniferula marina TaxID=2748318 RepID=A0A851GG84_9BACT|nr:phosphotransferase [Oceaniferula marina]NWK56219.1 phosphotransferase [Oceaniferula marina]